ncbi:MAG: PAS domain S-box protein [Bacteroidales bacterium]|nr:PAS domain S-box protein [Bacteroidales bacterium]MDT8431235.1 PAS domain S-box protein [Bacteroidales bacterium]
MVPGSTDKIPFEPKNPSEGLAAGMRAMEMHYWYWDIAERRLSVDPETIALLGYSVKEFDPGLPTFDRNIHPEDIKRIHESFNGFQAGETEVFEIEFRLKSNAVWNWYYARGAILKKSEAGQPELLGGLLMDISRRYNRMIDRAEEASKFEFIFRNTRQPVLIVTMGDEHTTGRILEANEAAERLFGGRLTGMDPYELIDSEYMDQRPELRARLINEGTVGLEVRTWDINGNMKYLDVYAHAYNYTGKNLFIAIITDKTESQRVKKELQASESALRQSEKIYRSLIQAADDRIGLFRTDGTPVMLNNAFSEVLGYSNDEFLKLEDWERIHPDDKAELEKKASQLFREKLIAAEYRVRHRDGHYLHMSSKSVLLKDPELEHDYVLIIIRDISGKVEFEKQLIAAKEKAEESDLLKSAFLANMSHEIRTPMNSIVGFANLLSDEGLDEETRREYIQRVNRNSEQLLALISDIIDLAKIESNQMTLYYAPIFVENLFKDLLNFGTMQLKQRDRTEISMEYDPDQDASDLKFESDLVRLTQILQNLVNNAVKFTHRGKITVGYRVHETTIRIFVKDTGTGIDRENFEVIFDQFRQLDGSNIRRYGGTGLGLSICRNLATLLKGKIWVESEMGSGSEFCVEIPLKTGTTVLSAEKNPVSHAEIDRDMRLLIVDDDPDNLMLLKTLLRNEGFQVVTADSGYRALEILEREALPGLVLLDLQMPVMSGLQTLKIIREKYPELKVAGQSAYAITADKERSMVAGFDAYITKPYDRNAMVSMIGQLLGK